MLASLSSSARGAETPDTSLQGEGGGERGRPLAEKSDDRRRWGWAQVRCFTAHGSPRPDGAPFPGTLRHPSWGPFSKEPRDPKQVPWGPVGGTQVLGALPRAAASSVSGARRGHCAQQTRTGSWGQFSTPTRPPSGGVTGTQGPSFRPSSPTAQRPPGAVGSEGLTRASWPRHHGHLWEWKP